MLPGSFNPLHKGHIGVLEEAAAMQHLPRSTSIEDGLAVFEISMNNADKGVIDEEELRLRLRGFSDIGASVVITAEHPTFVSKAKVRAATWPFSLCLLHPMPRLYTTLTEETSLFFWSLLDLTRSKLLRRL